MMNRWEYYRAEINRRQDEIKFAERYRLAKLAMNDPSVPPAPKFYKRLFSALGAMMVRWGTRLKDEAPAPNQDFARERP